MVYFGDPLLMDIASSQPYPLMFATLSGSHLYGFPSPDSDYDLRGVHILPLAELVSLYLRQETIEVTDLSGEIELDLVPTTRGSSSACCAPTDTCSNSFIRHWWFVQRQSTTHLKSWPREVSPASTSITTLVLPKRSGSSSRREPLGG